MKINFITSNQGKFEWAKRRLNQGNIELRQLVLPIEESRDLLVEDVVKDKAQKAKMFTQEPFIMEDTSFCIPALNNFPATQIKLVEKTIGVEGLIKLMDGVKNRTVIFRSALCFVNKNELKTFVCEDKGTIPLSSRGDHLHGFTSLLKIFIPEGFSKTLAEMSESEFQTYEKNIEFKDHYAFFNMWLLKNNKVK